MTRERVLKVVLVVIGLLFVAGLYPLIGGIRHPSASNVGDTMMMSLYVTLGIFLLMAVRDPAAHRSVIAFAAWSSFAHAATMVGQSIWMPDGRRELLIAAAAFTVVGAILVAAVPARNVVEKASVVHV